MDCISLKLDQNGRVEATVPETRLKSHGKGEYKRDILDMMLKKKSH